MRWTEPNIGIVFFAGVALLVAGQLVPSYDASAFLNLLGGALLVVVAFRALASWAGLHRDIPPALEPGETVLVESQGVMVQSGPRLFSTRRGPYRARLTERRLLLSLRVMMIPTQRDVTVAWLTSGLPLSVLAIELHGGGELALIPERRFGPRMRLWVGNSEDWRNALSEHHPELLRAGPRR
ncbi:MAG TPA: hypothetical protein VF157_13280 [Chloroflexota bacterium]